MTRLGPAAACELGAGANCAAVAGSRGPGFASRQMHASALCAALIAATLLAGCGGGSSVQIGEPPSGPTISGQVSMPNGTLASAPSLLQRLALQVVARVEALVAGNVEPVGSGVDVRLVRIDNGNIVDGQIRGGSLVGRVSTDADGRFSIRMPARTSPETCRFYLEVGDNGNRSLTRAFVYATDVNINFESETTVRLLLDQIKAGATTLCDLTAGDIQLVTDAVVGSDRQVFGDTAAAINSSAAVVAAADPAVQAAIQAAVGAPTAIPTSTITRTPRATASATRTGAAPTATTSVVPPPTRTATTVPTETQRPPTRTATTGEATATATSEEAATATATATAVVTDTAGPTNTVAATNTATPTGTVLPTNTAGATNTAAATATLTPTDTVLPAGTETPTQTPTDTVVPTDTVAPTDTVTPTNTVEATNTAGPTNTAVPTGTASATITATPTDTGTAGVTQTATATPTDTGTAGLPQTATATPTHTNTTAATSTASATTGTPAATNTPAATSTPIATNTAAASNTPAATSTPAATNTAAATSTASATSTPLATSTATRTLTATATRTLTATATRTLTATATRTATASGTPTPTATVGVSCPLTTGIYTTTQLTGGTLDVYNFAPFPFPSGGTIVQHVGAGDSNCVHNTVVPFPGGFSSPNFCVPALMFTTSVTQTGCGVGRIDSNGGSDFTMNEVADTSDAGCGFTSACTNGANKAIRADVTVGNAAADTCASGGTANALVTVPVHTKSWSDTSGGMFGSCPGDGVFNGTDMVAAEFDQILDFTTDTATGKWMDLDADGCTIAGFGPAAGYTKSGVCIDTGTNTITAVAVGEFGATGGLFDGTFATVLPSSFTGPSGAASATCGSPPAINFAGTVTRCIP